MPGNKAKIIFEFCVILIYVILLLNGLTPSFHENYYISLLYMKRNDYETAKKYAEEELKRSPHDVDTHLLFVRYYMVSKDMIAARKWLKKALEIMPTHKEARHFLNYFPSVSP